MQVVRRGARGTLVGGVDGRQVEHVIDHLGDEARFVVLGQPVVEARREQEGLGLIIEAEGLLLRARVFVRGAARLPGGTSKSRSSASTEVMRR